MSEFGTSQQWYDAAASRPQFAPDQAIEKRLQVARIMHKSSADAGLIPTQEMIDDEMLLITGRMDREEFNAYLIHKEANGGWC